MTPFEEFLASRFADRFTAMEFAIMELMAMHVTRERLEGMIAELEPPAAKNVVALRPDPDRQALWNAMAELYRGALRFLPVSQEPPAK